MTAVLDAAVGTAAEGDRRRLLDTLASAFEDDPAIRWIYPDPEQYRRNFKHFAQAFAGRAFAWGTAFRTGDGLGAALWLPPGIGPDEEALASLLRESVPGWDRESVFALFEEMGAYHPGEPHWYLPLTGVEPSRQGRGCGTALLRHALLHCDREGCQAYLECTNPRNIPLYERHGFKVLGTVQVASSPPVFPMSRPARR
jgi:GNAT superfamily N-acetyltransferase